jgi:hypothetical protein
LANEILEISDAPPPTFVDADGVVRIDSAGVQAVKLRVDSRKFLAAKLPPKVYRERITAHVTGSEHVLVNGAGGIMDEIDLARRIAFSLSRVAAQDIEPNTRRDDRARRKTRGAD